MRHDEMPPIGDFQKAGLTNAEYKIWLKRNRTDQKDKRHMTEAQWRFAVQQRRDIDDKIRDIERRNEIRWDR